MSVDQTRMHDPASGVAGNCAQAAVATLLGLPLFRVDDFTAGVVGEDRSFWKRFDAFFRERGLGLIRFDGDYRFDGLHLAGGKSTRGEHGHMVVRRGAEVVHDPHPSRAGLVEVTHTWVVVPLELWRWDVDDDECPECVADDRDYECRECPLCGRVLAPVEPGGEA